MVRRDGSRRDVEAVISNQLDRPSVAGYVTNVRDITERKKFEELLSHRALHDPLTGLANRQLILDRADQMLVRARRTGDPVAAFFVDLDNFKDTNDSLGHEAGDRLLQAVASRLVGLLRDERHRGPARRRRVRDPGRGRVARRRARGHRRPASARSCARRSTSRASSRSPSPCRPAWGSPSATAPSAQDLLRDADIALYRAKGAGRDQSVVFEEAMQLAANDRLVLRSELDAALAAGQFALLYQPIVDLTDLRIEGVEALIRWNHPTKGLITPDRFIPVLEDSGQIVDVGRWVLDEACAQLARWRAAGPPPLDVGQRVDAPARVGRRSSRTSPTALDGPRARPVRPRHRDHRDGADEGRPRHGRPADEPEASSASGSPSTTSAPATRHWPTSASSRSTCSRSTGRSCRR